MVRRRVAKMCAVLRWRRGRPSPAARAWMAVQGIEAAGRLGVTVADVLAMSSEAVWSELAALAAHDAEWAPSLRLRLVRAVDRQRCAWRMVRAVPGETFHAELVRRSAGRLTER